MIAATHPRTTVDDQRMLVVDRWDRSLRDLRVADLPRLVEPGDVWVLNDAGTLPAALEGTAHGRPVELRLAGERADGTWTAVLFGEGSWRDDTNARPAPPRVREGDAIELGAPLRAIVRSVDPRSVRLLRVAFEPSGDGFTRLLFALGRPIQYSYLDRALALDEVQTPYASRPVSVELPSAGRPLTARRIQALRREGAEVVTLTHAAGLSATGDPSLDARLPLSERYEIPDRTARAIEGARAEERRVVAVGTSVARAIEGSFATHGRVRGGGAETDLRIDHAHVPRVVTALLTGAHDPQSSHFDLLRAFVDEALLAEAISRSTRLGYRGHELGDSWLVT